MALVEQGKACFTGFLHFGLKFARMHSSRPCAPAIIWITGRKARDCRGDLLSLYKSKAKFDESTGFKLNLCLNGA